jgi:hypothetical protein
MIRYLIAPILVVGMYGLCWSGSGCESQGEPPWDDTRARSISGSAAVVDQAWARIKARIPLGNLLDDIEGPKYHFRQSESPCAADADGCMVPKTVTYDQTYYCTETRYCRSLLWHPYYGYYYGPWMPHLVQVPHSRTLSEKKFEIHVTDCDFHRGWRNIDPDGLNLTSDVEGNFYYRFSNDLMESVEFILLHELAHVGGVTSEFEADQYAQRMILQMRFQDKGLRAYYERPGSGRSSSVDASFACVAHGGPPDR